MRIIAKWAMLAYILCTCNLLAADEPMDAERDQLLEKLKLVESSLNEKAFERLVPLLDPDVVVIFLNGEVARGIPQVQAYFDKVLDGSKAILKDYRTQATVGAPARFTGNVAIADGTTKDNFTFADGSEMKVNTFWTVTLAKRDGDWKVLQLHFSSNFFNNPLVAAIEQKMFMFAVIALLVGLAIGYFVKRRRVANA
ncbi:MAG: nuclear transport factor 2 family protein [Candidatus Thiodiazotropha endolucinida]